MSEKPLMSSEEIARALVRIAHEVVEKNRGARDIVLVGVRTRGVPLAQRLAAIIRDFEGIVVPVGALDIGLHRDDVSYLESKPAVQSTDIPGDITDKQVVLVDDVLYTGRSIRAAMDALMDLGVLRLFNWLCLLIVVIESFLSEPIMWAGTYQAPGMRRYRSRWRKLTA